MNTLMQKEVKEEFEKTIYVSDKEGKKEKNLRVCTCVSLSAKSGRVRGH